MKIYLKSKLFDGMSCNLLTFISIKQKTGLSFVYTDNVDKRATYLLLLVYTNNNQLANACYRITFERGIPRMAPVSKLTDDSNSKIFVKIMSIKSV